MCVVPIVLVYIVIIFQYCETKQINKHAHIELMQGRVPADFARISSCHEWIRYLALYSYCS